MVVRTQPALPPDLSASVTEVMALPPPSFRKRYKPSCETSTSSSSSLVMSPTLPFQKRYRGTSDMILNTKKEGDKSEVEGTGSESEELEDKSTDFENEEAASKDQQQTVPVEGTTAEEPLGLGYGVARRRALELAKYTIRNTFEVGQSYRYVTDQQKADETPTPRSSLRQPHQVFVPLRGNRVGFGFNLAEVYSQDSYQMAIDYAAEGRLGKVRPKEGWKTIEDLA
nr:hypothetical protein [Tanacetum cinerariifolium]